MSKHHGLYKFVTCDTNEIIYIGKTNNNLKSRVADHIRGKGIDLLPHMFFPAPLLPLLHNRMSYC